MKHNPASQRFRRVAKQFRCGTAENKKSGWGIRAISQYAQKGEKIWPRLYLIQHHQTFERPQHKGRISQTSLIIRIFQIKMSHRSVPLRCQLSCQCRFSDLSRAEHGHNRKVGQSVGKLIKMSWARDHGAPIIS